MSHMKPNRGDKPFTFDVKIRGAVDGFYTEGTRTIYATSPQLARTILQSTLAVVYGVTRSKITSEAREGTR